jgi:hypothetical protein
MNMLSHRVQRILDAYFHSPVEEYIAILSSIKARGGLSQVEVKEIKRKALFIHSSTILRHVDLL